MALPRHASITLLKSPTSHSKKTPPSKPYFARTRACCACSIFARSASLDGDLLGRPTQPARLLDQSVLRVGRFPMAFDLGHGQGLQAGTGSADRLAGATLLSEVGASGHHKLWSGEGPVHQSQRVRGRRSSELVR
jgi:hypothetical protein